MDMVPNCVSVKAHARNRHDGRHYLFLSVDILRRVITVLDVVIPVIGYPTPDLSEDHLPGYIIKCDLEVYALALGLVVP